jgi:hypothetical protein
MIFQAAIGISASYDALVDLFECVGGFLSRLRIYIEIPFSPSMAAIITKIMVEVLSVLSLATKQIKEGRFSTSFSIFYICLVCDFASEKFAKKLLGASEIEDVLHRIDRLTLDEARMTGTETLQVVHGLVRNLKLVIGGTQLSLHRLLIAHMGVWIDGTKSMHDIWQALGMPGI